MASALRAFLYHQRNAGVMRTYFRLLFTLLWQPGASLRQLSQRAPVGLAAGVAFAVAAIYVPVTGVLAYYAQGGGLRIVDTPTGRPGLGPALISHLPGAAMSALLFVLFTTLLYVPFAILIANLFERRHSFSRSLRETFAPTAACALSCFSISLLVALLPAAVISWQGSQLSAGALVGYFVLLILIPVPIFAVLMTITLGTIFRIGRAAAAMTTLLSFLSLLCLPVLSQVFNFVCASPFLLLLLIFLLRERLGDVFQTQRARQAFKQNLEASTLNPADASAHYNLGLLYQQRGEFEAAEKSFRRAIEIDPSEVDANYQLGRMARVQGRLAEAIAHFETVVRQAPAHSQHEIWREIAHTYLEAKQYEDALAMIDRFLVERQSDAEGRYWRGQALAAVGRSSEAEAEMKSCIEAVRTSPAYKYRREQEWLKLAEQFLRERRA